MSRLLKENNAIAKIWIKDDGPGLTQDQLDKVFIPFVSFKDNNDVFSSGLGLGLPIADKYAKLLSGKIIMNSQKSKGSVVDIYFQVIDAPIKEINPDELKSDIITNFPFKKILLVEDCIESAELIKIYFMSYQMELIHAKNGNEAVELFYNNDDLDLVLCDIRLPDIDGYELVKTFKKIRPLVPIVAQTAFVFDEVREKCVKAGFDDYITKPINQSSLFNIINKYRAL